MKDKDYWNPNKVTPWSKWPTLEKVSLVLFVAGIGIGFVLGIWPMFGIWPTVEGVIVS